MGVYMYKPIRDPGFRSNAGCSVQWSVTTKKRHVLLATTGWVFTSYVYVVTQCQRIWRRYSLMGLPTVPSVLQWTDSSESFIGKLWARIFVCLTACKRGKQCIFPGWLFQTAQSKWHKVRRHGSVETQRFTKKIFPCRKEHWQRNPDNFPPERKM